MLNRGARLEVAAADFATAEEFLTVAHAARNTSVPFMVLKHRVLNEGQTLADAIRESKPALDARAETARARTEARSRLTATSSASAERDDARCHRRGEDLAILASFFVPSARMYAASRQM